MTKKVLIVEDEIFVALEIEEIVKDAGFDPQAIAADRAAAIDAADGCDIALVDLNLRDGPTGPAIGMELATRFGMRVIYVTANPAQIGEASVAALGVVTKPFCAQSIVGALRLAAADMPAPDMGEIAGFIKFAPAPGSWTGMGSPG
ncbi:MAG: response regulator [Sphingobium sp.]